MDIKEIKVEIRPSNITALNSRENLWQNSTPVKVIKSTYHICAYPDEKFTFGWYIYSIFDMMELLWISYKIFTNQNKAETCPKKKAILLLAILKDNKPLQTT